MKNIVKIKIDTTLIGENEKFLEFLCNLNQKEKYFSDTKELIEFLFITGLVFVHGSFIGSLMTENDSFSSIINPIKQMMDIKKIKIKQLNNNNDVVVFNRAFLNGEPADYQIADDGQELHLKYKTGKFSHIWQKIYLLNSKNKPLTWRGDSV